MGLVIPAIDVYDGKVVRLTRGDFSQMTVYSDNPIELVEFFYSKGFKRIHVVDLEGAKTGEMKINNLVKEIKNRFKDISLQLGGGIRSYEIAEKIINSGADFVIVGTMFVKKPDEFQKVVNDFRDRVILSLDINVDKVVIYGWQADSHFTAEDAFERALKMGVLRIMSTDITRDGTLLGPDIKFISYLLETIKRKYFDILIDEILNLPIVKSIVNESLESIVRSVNEFMDTLKRPFAGSYELRQKIESHDENIERYKDAIVNSVPWDEIMKKYPKPYLIISGGISSDSDIDEVFKLDNSFLEGVIVGKSIYEGRLTIFNR